MNLSVRAVTAGYEDRQTALLEVCYLPAAENRAAEKGGGLRSKAGHRLLERSLYIFGIWKKQKTKTKK